MLLLKNGIKGCLLSILFFVAPYHNLSAHLAPEDLSLTPTFIKYLKLHEVPSDIKESLNQLFLSPDVEDLIGRLYRTENYNQALAIREQLMSKGFSFLGNKLHVFVHERFPNRVFKMAMPGFERPEDLNAGRISFAQQLKSVIARHRLNIKIPDKWAYFMPRVANAIPKVIVVAEKINIQGAKQVVEGSPLWKDVGIVKKETGFSDDHSDNVMECGRQGVILDTEERKSRGILAKVGDVFFGVIGDVKEAIVG